MQLSVKANPMMRLAILMVCCPCLLGVRVDAEEVANLLESGGEPGKGLDYEVLPPIRGSPGGLREPPPPWQIVTSTQKETEGQQYYYNPETQQTSWDYPEADEADRLADGLREHMAAFMSSTFPKQPERDLTGDISCVGRAVQLSKNHVDLNPDLSKFICQSHSICVHPTLVGCPENPTPGTYCDDVERHECCSGQAETRIHGSGDSAAAYFYCKGLPALNKCWIHSDRKLSSQHGEEYEHRENGKGPMCGMLDGKQLTCTAKASTMSQGICLPSWMTSKTVKKVFKDYNSQA